MKIIFEAHATSYDNELEISSGYNDVDLSELGLKQAHELGERYKSKNIAAVYCSDLQRAYKTAAIAFNKTFTPIFIDSRLRECDYGELTQADASLVKSQRAERVSSPFPNGESYEQTCERVSEFIKEILSKHKTDDEIIIIGHRATQYGLEHFINNVPILEAVTAPWKWQPGWVYEVNL